MARRDFSPPESDADLLVDIVARKLESARQSAQRAEAVLREIVLQLFDDGEIGIQHVQRLLGEVAHVEAGSQTHLAGVGSRCAPAIILSSVVLPAPFRPITAQRSPRRMVRLKPS